jgi:sensor domain CHASE-containing protein
VHILHLVLAVAILVVLTVHVPLEINMKTENRLNFSPRNKILQRALRNELLVNILGDDGLSGEVIVHHVTDVALGSLQLEYEIHRDNGQISFHRTVLT